MLNITLPDGSVRQYESPVTVAQIAASIGAGLAKATVAGKVNGKLVDACDSITEDSTVQIITPKDQEGVEIIRHSCAHLVGHAVKQLYPNAKMVIGPVIEEGFYYDIATEKPFTPEDVAAIEARMKELIAQDYDVVKVMTPRAETIKIFQDRGEEYKLRLIEDMPEVEAMGMYHHQEYVDMCRGPHVPNTRFLKNFKLTKLAGAYWRGDSNNEMLQQLIADILDLSKIEAGTLEFVFSDVDINQMMFDLEQQFRMRVAELGSGVQIVREASEKEYTMHTDRNRLAQVVSNFMTNALKFTQEGSITLGFRPYEEGLYFYVKDTGTGIPQEKLPHVFERFVKLKQEKNGTGLGLSICQTIVRKLGAK